MQINSQVATDFDSQHQNAKEHDYTNRFLQSCPSLRRNRHASIPRPSSRRAHQDAGTEGQNLQAHVNSQGRQLTVSHRRMAGASVFARRNLLCLALYCTRHVQEAPPASGPGWLGRNSVPRISIVPGTLRALFLR